MNKIRTDSYEYLCGNRFTNSRTCDSEDSSLFTSESNEIPNGKDSNVIRGYYYFYY